jgi:hypothetical protein
VAVLVEGLLLQPHNQRQQGRRKGKDNRQEAHAAAAATTGCHRAPHS